SNNLDSAKGFVRESLFIDWDSRVVDTFMGDTLVKGKVIPDGDFWDTPLYVSTIVALRYIEAKATNPKKALIMLTDGRNDDNVSLSFIENFVDSMYKDDSISLYNIGYEGGGEVAALTSIAQKGGGKYFDATSPEELDSVYNELAGIIITQTIDTTITLTPILVKPDTIGKPLDVLLAFDLSGSMDEYDGTSRWRIMWAQISALKFIDSLRQAHDHVALLGWAANGDYSLLSDTSDTNKYYQKWFELNKGMEYAKDFVRNELYLDIAPNSAQVYTEDTCEGQTHVIMKEIKTPDLHFDDTPFNISTMVGLRYLAEHGGTKSNKVLIMLTDGRNDDNVPFSSLKSYVDSMYNNKGISLYIVGFEEGGQVTELTELAEAGGGKFFNAKTPQELQDVYMELGGMLVTNLAASNMMIQEVLSADQKFVTGSDSILEGTTAAIDSFVVSKDAN
ncbi:MAG: VWA domain-containing protein, partial [Nitrospirota bacterium]